MATHRLLVRNALQIVTLAKGELVKRGAAMQTVEVVENASLVVGLDGRIEAVGPVADIEKQFTGAVFENVLDATGACILPGFVDGHTHPVWAGDRVHEFCMKLSGATYMDIHKAGGGINFTVRHTREASEGELLRLLLQRMDRMLAQGTTLVEAKSGYGLDTDTECKMLRVLKAAAAVHPIAISATYCGGHAVPSGLTATEAADEIVSRHLPAIVAARDAGLIDVDNVDVFCEKGVFEVDDTRRILTAAIATGMRANFHGEELSYLGSGQMGAEVGARAISHLEHVSDEGIAAMVKADVVSVLLPTTAHVLRLTTLPPARAIIAAGGAVALGSDFNPNAHCLSMPYVMHLACVLLRMTPAEALVAATLNAAASVDRSADHGSLEPGKQANMVVLHAPRWEHILYQFADPPLGAVVVGGRVVWRAAPATQTFSYGGTSSLSPAVAK
eukprot:m.211235 g.211235  ORF g.211235 m.211235 type:complete len:445 (-) comp15559_c1_seq23:4592-5926(-)